MCRRSSWRCSCRDASSGCLVVLSSTDFRGSTLVVIFNRRALAARALRHSGLEEALRERELRFEINDTETVDEARAVAETAAHAGHVVVAAGGDGTAHAVLNGVLGAGRADTVMGHIPLGTGNDLGTALGRVGRGLEQALDALANPDVRAIDVAQVNGEEYFINALGIGFDAEVAHHRASHRFQVPGYFPCVVRTMLYYRPQAYRLTWPGGEWEGPALMTAAMNGRCEGGGFRLAPEARLDDGLLDVYRIDPVSFWQFLRYVWAVRRGTHGRLSVVQRWQTAKLKVESESRLQYHVDGEYRELPPGSALEIELHPRRLQMIT